MHVIGSFPGHVLEQAAEIAHYRGGRSALSCDVVAAIWRRRVYDPYFGGSFDVDMYPKHTEFASSLGAEWTRDATRPKGLFERVGEMLADSRLSHRTLDRKLRAQIRRCDRDLPDEGLMPNGGKYSQMLDEGKNLYADVSLGLLRLSMPSGLSLSGKAISNELAVFMACIPFCCNTVLGESEWSMAHVNSILVTATELPFSTAYRFLASAGVDVERMQSLLVEGLKPAGEPVPASEPGERPGEVPGRVDAPPGHGDTAGPSSEGSSARDAGDGSDKATRRRQGVLSLSVTKVRELWKVAAWETGLGALICVGGVSYAFLMGHAWKLLGWTLLGIGSLVLAKGVWDLWVTFKIKKALDAILGPCRGDRRDRH